MLVGEGYTDEEIELFLSDVDRFTEVLLGHEPYASQRHRINVNAANPTR